jgi:hypothetical protein
MSYTDLGCVKAQWAFALRLLANVVILCRSIFKLRLVVGINVEKAKKPEKATVNFYIQLFPV